MIEMCKHSNAILEQQRADIHRPCPRNLVDGSRKMRAASAKPLGQLVTLAIIARSHGADVSVHVFFKLARNPVPTQKSIKVVWLFLVSGVARRVFLFFIRCLPQTNITTRHLHQILSSY